MKKLNLGCGKDIREGWVNLDCIALPGVDVVHDITSIPTPFQDNTFDEVLCKDVLEHIEYIPVLKEIHRILKPGGKLSIYVPHFTSRDAYADPTHRRFFSINSFQFFIAGNSRSYYFDFHFSEILKTYISFPKMPSKIYFYNYLLERIVNSNAKAQNFYELSPLRVFPAHAIEVVMIK